MMTTMYMMVTYTLAQRAVFVAMIAHGETLAEVPGLGSKYGSISDSLSLILAPADGTSAAKLRALSSRWQAGGRA
jgi:hypothetical protein